MPRYWHNQDVSTPFDTRHPAHPAFAEQLQVLLDKTFKAKKTRDRDGALPTGLKLLKAQRVEDRAMWGRYCAAVEALREKHPQGCTPVNALDDDPDHGFVKTSEHMDDTYNERLDMEVNEYYLWHGTSPEGAMGISEDGFKMDFVGSNAGTMFRLNHD